MLRLNPVRDDLRGDLGRVRDELLEILDRHHRRDLVGEIALKLVGRLADAGLLLGPGHARVPRQNLWPKVAAVKAGTAVPVPSAENLLQELGDPRGGVLPDLLFFLAEHVKQAVEGLPRHVPIQVEGGGIDER